MDYTLLKSHIERSTHLDINPVLSEDNKNIAIFYMADTISPRKFTQNFAGYPRSDIAELNAATSLAEQVAIMEKLIDYGDGKNVNEGLTDSQIMLSHKSKYQQTPSEMISWIDSQLHQAQIQREIKAMNNNLDSNKINFVDTSKPSVDE